MAEQRSLEPLPPGGRAGAGRPGAGRPLRAAAGDARHRGGHVRRRPGQAAAGLRPRGLASAPAASDETLVVTGHRPRRSAARRPTSPGRCARPSTGRSLRRARVFVAAPRREDFGIAPLEALADGCMLVTTPAPGPVSGARPRRQLDPRLVSDDLAAARADRRSTIRCPDYARARQPSCSRRSAATRLTRRSPSACCHDCCQDVDPDARVHSEPVRERVPHRAALRPRVRDRVRVRGDGRDLGHAPALASAMAGDPDLVYEVAMWALPGRPDRRADLLPDHDPEPDPAALVGRRSRSGRAASGSGAGSRPAWPSACGCATSASHARRSAPVHGLRRAGAAGRTGDRAGRQLLQPGAVRQADDAAVGARRSPARTGRRASPKYWQYATFQPTFLYEIIWNLIARGRPGLARSDAAGSRPPGRVRAVRRRLLGLPDLRGDRCGSTTPTTSSGCA